MKKCTRHTGHTRGIKRQSGPQVLLDAGSEKEKDLLEYKKRSWWGKEGSEFSSDYSGSSGT